MIDENRVNEILQRVVEALRPEQGTEGGFDHILTALEHAFVFQMALACPRCRKNIARKLRSDLPMMLNKASSLARAAQQAHGEQHFLH